MAESLLRSFDVWERDKRKRTAEKPQSVCLQKSARTTVMCFSITCYIVSRWVPSLILLAPFIQPRSKPGREVCSLQEEWGSRLFECRVICAQSAHRAGKKSLIPLAHRNKLRWSGSQKFRQAYREEHHPPPLEAVPHRPLQSLQKYNRFPHQKPLHLRPAAWEPGP